MLSVSIHGKSYIDLAGPLQGFFNKSKQQNNPFALLSCVQYYKTQESLDLQ